MKYVSALLGLALLASSAHAQSRFQLSLGATIPDGLHLGLSVDVSRLSQGRTALLYTEGFGISLGGGGGNSPNNSSVFYDGTDSLGVALRQRRGTIFYGVGVGGYTTHYNASTDFSRTRLGGKLFVGVGAGGAQVVEVTYHYAGNTKDSRATVGIGLRL